MGAYLIHIFSKDLLQIQTGAAKKILGESEGKKMQKFHLRQNGIWETGFGDQYGAEIFLLLIWQQGAVNLAVVQMIIQAVLTKHCVMV